MALLIFVILPGDMKRFRDENKGLSHFYNNVWVVCSKCNGKAIATSDLVSKKAKLVCTVCGYNKETSIVSGKATFIMAAHGYFNAALWLKTPFRDEIFWAYNLEHLEYLEQYIEAGLREHKNRTGFTLLEKLPKFYHEAKNRDALLRLIAKLKLKK